MEPGAWSLEPGADVLDYLEQLRQSSLILTEEPPGPPQSATPEVRYRLLETLREFAWERLQEAGEVEASRARHRDWYLALAEQSQVEGHGPSHGAWLNRLEQEHDNLRAALEWCREESEGAEAALRLGTALDWFWLRRGYVTEGRRWLAEALARGDNVSTAVRAGAISSASLLAINQSDHLAGETLAREARRLYEEMLEPCRREGDIARLARLLHALGGLSSDLDASWTYLQESAALLRQVGDRRRLASVLLQLSGIPASRGDQEMRRALLEECLALGRAEGERAGLIHVLGALGHIAREEGEYDRARALYLESLALRREVGDRGAVGQSLEDLACLDARQGLVLRAARLLGAADTYVRSMDLCLPVAVPEEYDRAVTTCREALGEEAFAAAQAEGRSMSLEQALEWATEGA